MPPIRMQQQKHARLCRTTDAASGREVIQHTLPSELVNTFDKNGTQYRYHLNILKYANKSINIRGEYTHGLRARAIRSKVSSNEGGKPAALRTSDLELVRILGKGAFGSVGVAKVKKREPRHPNDIPGAQIAIKIIQKRKARQDAPLENAIRSNVETINNMLNLERRNLAELEWNPFIAGLYDCLQDSKNLYLLMELGHLGSLGNLIREKGALPTSVCRFYFANLVKVVEFLHDMDLIHSDLKPDNIVIGADGYLMLCDMGISAYKGEQRNWNQVGTTTYNCPEALQGFLKAETAECLDWWAVACVLYEMATGRALFRYLKGDTEGELSQQRQQEFARRICSVQWYWPRGLDVDTKLKDLVEQMLEKDWPYRRGAFEGKRGRADGPLKNDEIREHPFMRLFPWKKLSERALVAPFVPSCMPDLKEEWHTAPLPKSEDVPGLVCVEPAQHCKWDTRFRREKDEARGDRKKIDSWLRKQKVVEGPLIVKRRPNDSMVANNDHDSVGRHDSSPGTDISKHSAEPTLSERTKLARERAEEVGELRLRS